MNGRACIRGAFAAVAATIAVQALAAPCGRKIVGLGHEFYDRHAAEALAVGGEFRRTPLDGIALPMFVRPKDGFRWEDGLLVKAHGPAEMLSSYGRKINILDR